MKIPSFTRNLARFVAAFSAALLVSSCGGGGGGGSVIPSTGGGGAGGGGTGGWVSGVFQAASNFKSRCETPRSGVDIEGNAFTDVAGTALDEKNWLRSWTNETYLWNTEVLDANPANGGTRIQYFDSLKTNATTASGKPKDQFHFSEPTADYLARRNSAASASYGAEFVLISRTAPRDVRVSFTDPGTPADETIGGQKQFVRGSQILFVDGVDMVNANTQAEIDILNAGLFPKSAGKVTVFIVRDPGSATTRTVSLVAQNLASKPVNRTRVFDGPTGRKFGYLHFTTFSPYASETELVDAMRSFKSQGVNELVLDLRYNGGGLLAVASQLGYMIAGNAATNGKTFESLKFNAAAGNRNPVTGQVSNPVPFYDTGLGFTVAEGTALPTLNLSRVFVLVTEDTCSASEAVINGLRGIGFEVVLIGSKTCGKPYGFYPQDNCGQTYYTIQFQGVNHLGFGDYADGFLPLNSPDTVGVKVPGCEVADDFGHELGSDDERMLKTAVSYSVTSVCPLPSATAAVRAAPSTQRSGANLIALETPAPWIMSVNRDMTMPERR